MTSYFSYVSLILRQSVPKRLPLWLERGLAGVLSNTVVRDQLVLVGPVIPGNINEFRDGGRFRVGELVSMTDRSPAFRGDDAVRKFDAQSWALVHMLWFGDKGAHSAALQHFMDAVVAGGDPNPAFREALGSPEALEEPLNVYVGRNVFSFQQLQADASVKREAFPVRPLAPSESASLRAIFHTAMNLPVDARAAIAEARKAGPSPDADVAEGLLLEREGKTDEAQSAYQRAVDAGSTSPFANRRLASLLWRRQPDHDQLVRIEALLAKATELNIRDDYAYAMRGEARSDLGEHDGLGFVRRAISLAPQEADHHLSAARLLAREQKFDDAQQELQTATALAQSDEERQRVRALAQWLDTARGRGGR
jgi:tetratricopeptide (TPR) repeat protein